MSKAKTATPPPTESGECSQNLQPVQDALYVLSGKWKLPIIIALGHGNQRFKELLRHIPGITPRVLSKELKELEANELVTRTVYDTMPVSIEYRLTDYADTLKPVVQALHNWGALHRKRILKKKK